MALQAIGALPGLLTYPPVPLAFRLLRRTFAALARRLHDRVAALRTRHPRRPLVAANPVVVGPLVVPGLPLGIDDQFGFRRPCWPKLPRC